MARVPNYDDLAGFKTPTQRRIEGQVAQLLADMKRIDAVVANGTFEQLKALHVELDGTYQNLVKNWGTSMYNYIPNMGFTYEYIDADSFQQNLLTMKAKLRGLLFEIDPSAEDTFSADVLSTGMGAEIDESSDSLPARSNIYEIIHGRKFDATKEYARIWKLFNTGDLVGPRATPLSLEVSGNLQFFPNSFKNRALTLDDFNDTYGFKFPPPGETVSTDELVSYCEYVITLCDHLWEYGSDSLDDDAEYLRDDLYQTVESCMDELGLEAAKRDNITIYVDKEPTVTAVSEIVDESLSYDVKSYIHKQTKGDLQKKKTILKFLADDIEPKRNTLNGINKTLSGNLFQMLQKFVRHNNEDNAYIKGLSPAELEACYDDIYQMWLLATLELANVERMQRVKKTLGEINSPTA